MKKLEKEALHINIENSEIEINFNPLQALILQAFQDMLFQIEIFLYGNSI